MKSLTDFPNKKEYYEYLRPYFAGLAMQGLLSKEGWSERQINENTLNETICKAAIKMADELLTQLEQTP